MINLKLNQSLIDEFKEDGFLITPSGMKNDELKVSDIVFVSLKGKYDKKNNNEKMI